MAPRVLNGFFGVPIILDMKPSKVIAFEERRLKRKLTEDEHEAIKKARDECDGGKQATTNAMRSVLADKSADDDPPN
jgi:hypothetical protein